MNPWIVLDLETTGLDPQKDLILELYATEVDPKSLLETNRRTHLLTPLCRSEAKFACNEFTLKMHTDNRLLDDLPWQGLIFSDYAAEKIDEQFFKYLTSVLAVTDAKQVHLVGNSVHFDLSFIKRWLPNSAALISHRIIDVSSLKLVMEATTGVTQPRATAHRAKPDVEESLDYLRSFCVPLFMLGKEP